MKIYINRTGEFAVEGYRDASTQCGWNGNDVLSYRVYAETTDDSLDDRGFIIDNMDIHRYFTSTYKSVKDFISCEKIALRAVVDLAPKIKNCQYIKVEISGEPGAAWLGTELYPQKEHNIGLTQIQTAQAGG